MTAVVVAAAVLLLARPWESDGGASGAPDFGDAELVLEDSDNKRRPATARNSSPSHCRYSCRLTSRTATASRW